MKESLFKSESSYEPLTYATDLRAESFDDEGSFIKKELVEPLLLLKKTATVASNSIVERGEWSDEDFASFNEAMDKEFPVEFLESIETDFEIKQNSDWLSFRKKKEESIEGKDELRCYLSVKCRNIPKVTKLFLSGLREFSCFRYLKVSYAGRERIDNVIIYFSEHASKTEMGKFFHILDDIARNNESIFNEWDIPTPFGSKIILPKEGEKEMPVGSIAYLPFKSSNQALRCKEVDFNDKSFFSQRVYKTPNSLVSGLKDFISYWDREGLPSEKIAERILNTTVYITKIKQDDSVREFSIIDLMKFCKNEVKNRL